MLLQASSSLAEPGDLLAEDAKTGLFLASRKEVNSLQPLLEAGGMTIGTVCEMQKGSAFLEKITPTELHGHAIIVLDLVNRKNPLPLIREVRERCPRHIDLVVIGKDNDISFYRQALAAGAKEYFAQPFPADELVHAMRRILKLDAPGIARSGKMIAVHGTQGGIGAGVLTAGLAELLSETHGRSSAVIDTNFSSPSVGACLGCDMPGDLGLLLDEADRVDKVLIEQIIQRPCDNLALLDGHDRLGMQRIISPGNVQALIELLGNQYRYQIWRTGGNSLSMVVPVLAQADIVIIMVAGTLPSARSAQGALHWLNEHNPSARVLPVYNAPSPNPPIPADVLENLSGRPFAFSMPYQKNLGEQIMKKVRFSDASHCLHRFFEAMAHDILGVKSEHKSFWRRLFR